MLQTHSVLSKDGTSIFFREANVPQPAQTVVLVHGFAEYSGRYGHVIKALNHDQIAVFAMDLRGHGKSGGIQGHMDSIEQYVDDIHAVVTAAKEKNGVSKVILMAHSMGGLAACHYASRHSKELAGLVLSSPLMGIKVPIPFLKRVVGEAMARFLPLFRLQSTIDATNLTHDKKMQKAYCNDQNIFHYVRAKWFTQIQLAIAQVQDLAVKIKIPLLMQLSEPDRIVDSEQSRVWFQKCASADKTEIVYGGFFHEIYNEAERDRPINDAVKWIFGHQ